MKYTCEICLTLVDYPETENDNTGEYLYLWKDPRGLNDHEGRACKQCANEPVESQVVKYWSVRSKV